MSRKIEIHTTYENVDDGFLEDFIARTNLGVHADNFRQGDAVVLASQDPEGEVTAITTWQVIEEFDQ